jgi:hypothetical protein
MHITQRIAAAAGDDCELTGNVTGRLSKMRISLNPCSRSGVFVHSVSEVA